ncbi:hypothetical protein DH2020_023972 [Rehmannia glutinosa]|uniref:Uncharacterized protein n=1 Tax=Rehmannia glutinosa TaxID=99300 RepID=A0ABR0WBD2_REHGL
MGHVYDRKPRVGSVGIGARENVVKGFFELPFEEKKSSVGTYMSTDNMGYGRNFVKSEDQPLDWIDRLAMKAAPEGATDGLCVWPKNPANFRHVIEKYVKAAREVLDELLQALAEAISLDKGAFLQYFDQKTSEINVRVNYYPPCPRPDLALGITPPHRRQCPHTLAPIRILEWAPNFIEIMSNGRLKSSWHRAVTQSDTDRFSVALFYIPPAQMEIGPVKDGEPIDEEYKKVVVGEYLKHFYKVNPTATKEAIMFAKIRAIMPPWKKNTENSRNTYVEPQTTEHAEGDQIDSSVARREDDPIREHKPREDQGRRDDQKFPIIGPMSTKDGKRSSRIEIVNEMTH